jgi:hypothetical protein
VPVRHEDAQEATLIRSQPAPAATKQGKISNQQSAISNQQKIPITQYPPTKEKSRKSGFSPE